MHIVVVGHVYIVANQQTHLVSEQSPRSRERAVAASISKWPASIGDKSVLLNPIHLPSDPSLLAVDTVECTLVVQQSFLVYVA